MLLKREISLNHNPRDLTECDRPSRNLSRPQFIQVDKKNHTLSQDQKMLAQFEQLLDHIGVISLAIEGEVQLITHRAEQLLSQYLSPCISHSLPETLQHWIHHQIERLRSNDQVPSACLPLHIEQAGRQLSLSLILEPIRNQYLILLQEQESLSFSIAALQLLGLTKREAEVLFWIAKDKSNAAIARVLDCSEGTVRKHLEHLHGKLGVQTRTGAVMVALERLGLLTGEFVAISS